MMRSMRRFMVMGLVCLLASCQAQKSSEKVPPMPQSVPPPPPVRAMAIDPQLREAARKELLAASTAGEGYLRANAIEALSDVDAADAEGVVLKGLRDADPGVRYAAAMAAGKMRLASAYQPLLAAVEDKDRLLQAGVRLGLHKLGDVRFSHDLEKLAFDPDPYVRANTAMVFGLLGEPSAIPILKRMMRDVPVVRIQAAEALWRLGDEDGLNALVAYSISLYPDDQVIALLALAEPRDQRVMGHIIGELTSDYAEVSLAAARAAGELGADDGWYVAIKGAGSEVPRQRGMAALAMGAIGRADLQPYLRDLLKDPEAAVRVAAATAILELHGG